MPSSFIRTRRSLVAAITFSLQAFALTASAQVYPSKLVTGIVAYPAGAQGDVTARLVVPELQRHLGQTVIVENIAGVGGTRGAQKALAAPADGHTLLLATAIETTQTPLAMASAKYKAEDFRMVGQIASTHLMLVVRPTLPVHSVNDLIALSKKTADRPLTFGSVGRGSVYHLVTERFAGDTGIKLLHVPYKGAAPLITDAAGGAIDIVFMPVGGPVLGMIQKGLLKPLAYTGSSRHAAFPDIPTMEETGLVKNFKFDVWLALMASKSTPEAVMVKLNAVLREVMREPKVRVSIAAAGGIPAAPMTLAEAARFYADETASYRAIAQSIGLQPE